MRLTFAHKVIGLVAGTALVAGVSAASVGYGFAVRAFEEAARVRLRAAVKAAAAELGPLIAPAADVQSAPLVNGVRSDGPGKEALRAALVERVVRWRAEGLWVDKAYVLAEAPHEEFGLALVAHGEAGDALPAPRKDAARAGPVVVRTGDDESAATADEPEARATDASVTRALRAPKNPGRYVADSSLRPRLRLAELGSADAYETGLRWEEGIGARGSENGDLVRGEAGAAVWVFAQRVPGAWGGGAGDAKAAFVALNIDPRQLRAGSEAAFRGVQVGGLVALVVGGGLGLVGTLVLTRPLSQVAAGLKRMSAGDLDTPLEPTSSDEVGEMALCANHAMELLREQIELKQSLRLAQQVQRALLPEGPPRFAGLDIACVCVYCDQTGGDYVDHLRVPHAGGEAGLALVVGDVTGHGIPAALLMATARAILRSSPPSAAHGDAGTALADFMGRANRELCVQGQTGRFMTLFLLLIEPGLRGLRWVSAGHDGALVYDPLTQGFSELNGSDLPLGVEPAWAFTPCASGRPLAAGQVIVIGTDGIWELRSKADKHFGKENLKRVIRKHASLSAHQIGQELLHALDAHRGEMPAQDDITFVVVKVGEPTGEARA